MGLLMVVLGLVLGAGGIFLWQRSGSPYFVVTGAGFAVSGALLMRGRMMGLYAFTATFVTMFVWSLIESRGKMSEFMPRVALAAIFLLYLWGKGRAQLR
jgi:quinoprotein glucose dehydrogenase